MNKETGGSAFPCDLDFDHRGSAGNSHAKLTGGMTLRDYFAAKAMAAIISKNPPISEASAITREVKMISLGAYDYADAMLEARK